MSGVERWLVANAPRFDAAVVLTYLYWPAATALVTLSGRLPTVFMPTAHRELYLDLPLFDSPFALADGSAFLTPEEHELVDLRFGIGDRPSDVIGIGIDKPRVTGSTEFRAAVVPNGAPYLLCLGRIDPGKGAALLFDYFAAYKQRRPGPLRLVYVGERVTTVPEHPDVTMTGFVGDDQKQQAIAGAVASRPALVFRELLLGAMRGLVARTAGARER